MKIILSDIKEYYFSLDVILPCDYEMSFCSMYNEVFKGEMICNIWDKLLKIHSQTKKKIGAKKAKHGTYWSWVMGASEIITLLLCMVEIFHIKKNYFKSMI